MTIKQAGRPGLYIHVPFCARACPYCDFDFAVNRAPDVTAYLEALDVEVEARGLGGRPVQTVYVGGGTPSVLGPEGLPRLLAWVADRFDSSAVREWTVECNPEHVDAALATGLSGAGVSRVSLGIQSLAAGGLRQLGRAHGPQRAIEAIEQLRNVRLGVSADLIVGWPSQSRDGLRRELAQLLEAGIEHLSVYALTVESGTPWEKLIERGVRDPVTAEHQAELLEAAASVAETAGWSHYEIASYHAPHSGAAIHNSLYWQTEDYIGLGPSAASAEYLRDAGGAAVVRRTNPKGREWWTAQPPTCERLGGPAAAAEALWLGLRLLEGVDLRTLQTRMPQADRAFVEARAARQLELGNLEWTEAGGRLRVAEGRWLFHDAIAADLL